MQVKQNDGPQTSKPNVQLNVRWDVSDMNSSYANVTNVSSTRDEVSLLFGLNQSWERNPGELNVQALNRIMLSPYTAKRLGMLLNDVIREYEARFGELNLEGRRQQAPTPS